MEAAVEEIKGRTQGGAAKSPADELHEDEKAIDDQSGAELDPQEVERAMIAEIEYFKSMGVYEKVPIEECWSVTGSDPVSTRWVDIDKGDTLSPNYTSRLVVR